MTDMCDRSAGEIKPQSIQEVRAALEVAVAGLAASRARPEHLQAMRAAIDMLRTGSIGIDTLAEADLAFHQALADATGNPLFSLVVQLLCTAMFDQRRRLVKEDDAMAARRAILFHELILERIEAGNVSGARRAMRAHLAEAKATWRRTFSDPSFTAHVR